MADTGNVQTAWRKLEYSAERFTTYFRLDRWHFWQLTCWLPLSQACFFYKVHPESVRVRAISLIERNVADTETNAERTRTYGIYPTISWVSKKIANAGTDTGRAPRLWNVGLWKPGICGLIALRWFGYNAITCVSVNIRNPFSRFTTFSLLYLLKKKDSWNRNRETGVVREKKSYHQINRVSITQALL
jgi:hypothetical protein